MIDMLARINRCDRKYYFLVTLLMSYRGSDEGDDKDRETTCKQSQHSYWNQYNCSCSSPAQAMHSHDRKDVQHKLIERYEKRNKNASDRYQANYARGNAKRYMIQQVCITLRQKSPLSTKGPGEGIENTHPDEENHRYKNNVS